MDSTDRFIKKYNFSKSSKPQSSDNLRDYEEETRLILAMFREITGRKTNEDFIKQNLEYYLNEGFEIDDIEKYIKAQKNTLYYQQNPDRFFLRNLFPIGEKERQSMVWDLLEYQRASRKEPARKAGLRILTKCGEKILKEEYEAHSEICFQNKGKCFPPI